MGNRRLGAPERPSEQDLRSAGPGDGFFGGHVPYYSSVNQACQSPLNTAALDTGRMSEVGKRVRGLRKALGLTQEQLSRRAGVSQPTISHIERGHTADLTGANLSALCGVLRTNAEFLLHGKGTPSPPLQAELEERELIDLFRRMDHDQQQALLTFVRSMKIGSGTPNESNPYPGAKRAAAN